MRPRPGSLAFLLANDVRLSRRRFADIFRGLGPRGRAVLLVVVVLGVHLLDALAKEQTA